jgi:adenine deaminase
MTLDELIQKLPKTENHLHIEGAVPLELLRTLNPAKHARPPESWDADFRYKTFSDFDTHILDMVVPWYTSPERYHEAAKAIFKKLRDEENVRYVETSFASGVVEFGGIDGKAIAEAIATAAPENLEVRVFLGFNHNAWNSRTKAFIEDCVNWKYLNGIDLHGEETLPLEPWAEKIWKKFNDAGKTTKAHAGEFCGPAFVREVVEKLNIRRLEHGERAARDRALLREIRDRGITLDMCPISNLKLCVVPSIAEHPLHNFIAMGLHCTINTDDPICFGNKLSDEYKIIADEGGFSKRELIKLTRFGFEAADVDESKRKTWLAELDALAAGCDDD